MKAGTAVKHGVKQGKRKGAKPLAANGGVDYEGIVATEQYQGMLRRKKRFIIPMTIFFLLFYFMLPILTSYSTVLNKKVYGDISWAWVYATAQFVVAWVLCTVYVKKSASFDRDADEILETIQKDRGAAK